MKYIVTFILLFINGSILADEYTSIQTSFVNLKFTTYVEEDTKKEDEETVTNPVPNGKPVENGRLSSEYGLRKDPFTGQQQHHSGIDIAAEKGSEVKAVTSGTVTRAGRYGKYGNLVEIDHGNEYVTRYGHNEEVLVQVGDMVKKGDVIAHVGSSGRSTGPHLHYEVLHHSTEVDPAEFLESNAEDVSDKGKDGETEEFDVYENESYEDEVYEAEVYEDEYYDDELNEEDSEEEEG